MSTPATAETESPITNLVIRGQVYSDHLVAFGGRGGDLAFRAPDARRYLGQLPLGNPGRLSDLHTLSFEDILDYLDALGRQLDVRSNRHLQRARALSYQTAPTTPPIVDAMYAQIGSFFARDVVREEAETQIGIHYLDGWVEEPRRNGVRLAVRCFGARTLHIVAGNAPMISALSIVRNAILRSDAIIKVPSNDPFTAIAIAETMCEMAPDHPITKHLSVGYWRGGDLDIEEKLYQPHNIEKIVAWGGFASVKHVTRYIQPGLELISLDPKRSASIVGAEAFKDEAAMRDAAIRIASDVGSLNQVGCVNARVVYCLSGTNADGLRQLNALAQRVYEEIQSLPAAISTIPKSYDRALKAHVDAARLQDDWFYVVGGRNNEGAVIASQTSDAVSFATMLADRTVNLVPVDSLEEIISAVNAYTQTVGIYPEALRRDLENILPLFGAQRLVSLGYAVSATTASPQDGIEVLRRMGKWVTNEISNPQSVAPPWKKP